MPQKTEHIVIADSLANVSPSQWDALAGNHPALRHAWLHGLEATQCAVASTGWHARHILLYRNKVLVGAMPLYLKTHSRGEYVFDHAWAHAWHRHGLSWYPKALSAVPFTPVPGSRLLARDAADKVTLLHAAIDMVDKLGLSSLHILFPDDADRDVLERSGLLMRQSVQFHWTNRAYRTLDDFMADLNQKNRKKMRQSRRKLDDQGVHFECLEGDAISAKALDFFYRCYHQTYMEHGNPPYLSRDFFFRLLETMPECLVLIMARRGDQPVASALNLRGPDALYGRYWGSLEFISGLHFEACYMQGIEYCIARNIGTFEGGAQGEHKLARGLLPVKTWSAHWISDERFSQAIAAWLEQEKQWVDAYIRELQDHSPYRKSDA